MIKNLQCYKNKNRLRTFELEKWIRNKMLSLASKKCVLIKNMECILAHTNPIWAQGKTLIRKALAQPLAALFECLHHHLIHFVFPPLFSSQQPITLNASSQYLMSTVGIHDVGTMAFCHCYYGQRGQRPQQQRRQIPDGKSWQGWTNGWHSDQHVSRQDRHYSCHYGR